MRSNDQRPERRPLRPGRDLAHDCRFWLSTPADVRLRWVGDVDLRTKLISQAVRVAYVRTVRTASRATAVQMALLH
jgi:hypothetical protein